VCGLVVTFLGSTITFLVSGSLLGTLLVLGAGFILSSKWYLYDAVFLNKLFI